MRASIPAGLELVGMWAVSLAHSSPKSKAWMKEELFLN